MTFHDDMQAMTGNPAWPAAIQSLARYLDERGYHILYKSIVPPGSYVITPSFFSRGAQGLAEKLAALPGGGFPGCALGRCLTAHVPVPEADFDGEERELARTLAAIGLIAFGDAFVSPRRLQLLSVGDRYLLVDAAIHFPGKALHDIYIGSDTLLLMHCMGGAAAGKESRALDLCSGTGIVGLFMAKTCTTVVSTDIFPAALDLIHVNAVLNETDKKVSVREEPLQKTLALSERFDIVACNPPFVAIPPGFDRPLYAAGPDNDGLGYMRMLLDKAPNLLNAGGEGYFVADMAGDGLGAHFFRELAAFAEKSDSAIDALVMNRVDARLQAKAMAHLLRRLRPDADAAEMEALAKRFMFEELRASHYYLTVIRMRKGGKTGTRVLNLFSARRFDDYFSGT